MNAVEALLNGMFGPEPTTCPIRYLIPDRRKAYAVPRDYRALLALIVEARQILNKYGPSQPYYQHSYLVEARAHELNMLLERHSGTSGLVEYHADWLYSVLTDADIVREHEEFEERTRDKALEPHKGGLSFAYRERPPEICGLWEYMCPTK